MDAKTVDAIVEELALEEKIALLSGADVWRTVAIERLNIGQVKVTDGPNGVRGDGTTGATAVCLPASICLAAAFDRDLAASVGQLLGRETQRKGSQVLLAPTINIARYPLGGRNFESFGEDPLLTAALAVAYIDGVQSEGVAACAKHFVANDVEWRRLSADSVVSDSVLREEYLVPFERAVAHGVRTVMAAYPRLNGTFCSQNRWLLTDLLRGEWHFDGVVLSDWGAVRDPAAVEAGLDLEMPGPALEFGDQLASKVADGAIDPDAITTAARRIVRLASESGRIGSDLAPLSERSVDDPSERDLVRRVARQGMVLLANNPTSDGTAVLPFDPSVVRTLAVVGPNALDGELQGGGSAELPAHYRVGPVAGLAATFDTVRSAPGVLSHRYLPAVAPEAWVPDSEGKPVLVEVFDGPDIGRDPAVTYRRRTINAILHGPQPGLVNAMNFSQRLTGKLRIDETGQHQFSIMQTGKARVYVNDELVVDNWTVTEPGDGFFQKAAAERRGSIELVAGTEASIRVDWQRGDDGQLGAVRLGWIGPVDEDALFDEAITLVSEADAAVVVVGLNADWETESHDRPLFGLPGRQADLIAQAVAANPNTVIVVNGCGPIDMPWLDDVPAALLVWYPGQEFGAALAEVISGAADPGGRLPITLPKALGDSGASRFVPGDAATSELHYGEGHLIGYRWFDRHDIEPLRPFGFGLSYAAFDFGEPHVTMTSDTDPDVLAAITVDVTNVAERSGTCVVQAYVESPLDEPSRPRRRLGGFSTAELAAGETKTLTLALDRRAFEIWCEPGWDLIDGIHVVRIGTSSRAFFSSVNITC